MKLPKVSIIVACYNEEAHINSCLHSLVHQLYPLTEIIVIDGCSSDDTWGTCNHYRETYGIKLLSNPKHITPISWNIGIRASTGDLIMICGAHSEYPMDYVSKHVEWIERTGADNVGGTIIYKPRTKGILARALTLCKSDKFGVGPSDFRTKNQGEPILVDTVFGGCYKRAVFSRIGYFNESLRYSSDLELNLRLKAAGLSTYLIPSIHSTYLARSTLAPFLKNSYKDGKWVVLPFKYTKYWDFSWRLVPLLFVITLPLSIIPYTFLNWCRSKKIAISNHDIRLLPIMMFVFYLSHLSYGIGSLSAVLRRH